MKLSEEEGREGEMVLSEEREGKSTPDKAMISFRPVNDASTNKQKKPQHDPNETLNPVL